MNTRMYGGVGVGECDWAHVNCQLLCDFWCICSAIYYTWLGFIQRQTIRTLLVPFVFWARARAWPRAQHITHAPKGTEQWALTHTVGNHIFSVTFNLHSAPSLFPIVSPERSPFSQMPYDNWRLTKTTNWYAHKTRKQKCLIVDVVFDFFHHNFRSTFFASASCTYLFTFIERMVSARSMLVQSCAVRIPAAGGAVIRFNTLWQ